MTNKLKQAIATLCCVDGNTYVSEFSTFNSAFTIHLPNGGDQEDFCSLCQDVWYTHSRLIIHHELYSTMQTPDVARNVEAALEKTGLSKDRRPKILSDNGSCYVSHDIKSFMKEKGITQVHGAPMHPQT